MQFTRKLLHVRWLHDVGLGHCQLPGPEGEVRWLLWKPWVRWGLCGLQGTGCSCSSGGHWFPCLTAVVDFFNIDTCSGDLLKVFCWWFPFLVTSLKFLLPQIHRGCFFIFILLYFYLCLFVPFSEWFILWSFGVLFSIFNPQEPFLFSECSFLIVSCLCGDCKVYWQLWLKQLYNFRI